MTDGLIWVGGTTFDANYAVGSGGAILLDPTCATQVRFLALHWPVRRTIL